MEDATVTKKMMYISLTRFQSSNTFITCIFFNIFCYDFESFTKM